MKWNIMTLNLVKGVLRAKRWVNLDLTVLIGKIKGRITMTWLCAHRQGSDGLLFISLCRYTPWETAVTPVQVCRQSNHQIFQKMYTHRQASFLITLRAWWGFYEFCSCCINTISASNNITFIRLMPIAWNNLLQKRSRLFFSAIFS